MEIGIHIAQDAYYLIDMIPERRTAVMGFIRAKMHKSGRGRNQSAAKQAHTSDMIQAFREQGASEEKIQSFMRGVQWETQ